MLWPPCSALSAYPRCVVCDYHATDVQCIIFWLQPQELTERRRRAMKLCYATDRGDYPTLPTDSRNNTMRIKRSTAVPEAPKRTISFILISVSFYHRKLFLAASTLFFVSFFWTGTKNSVPSGGIQKSSRFYVRILTMAIALSRRGRIVSS